MASKKQIVIKVPLSTALVGSLITLLFTILKFLGFITWPWWLVLTPLWFPITTTFLFLFCAMLGVAFISFLAWLFNR
jgi:hypothetical protein